MRSWALLKKGENVWLSMMRKVACLIPSHHDLEEEEGASEKCVARYCSSSSPFLDRITISKGFFGQGGLQSKEDLSF